MPAPSQKQEGIDESVLNHFIRDVGWERRYYRPLTKDEIRQSEAQAAASRRSMRPSALNIVLRFINERWQATEVAVWFRFYPIASVLLLGLALAVGLDLGMRYREAQIREVRQGTEAYFAEKASERPSTHAAMPEAVFSAGVSQDEWDLCHRAAALEFTGKLARLRNEVEIAKGKHMPCSAPGMVPQCVAGFQADGDARPVNVLEDECRSWLTEHNKCYDDRGEETPDDEPSGPELSGSDTRKNGMTLLDAQGTLQPAN